MGREWVDSREVRVELDEAVLGSVLQRLTLGDEASSLGYSALMDMATPSKWCAKGDCIVQDGRNGGALSILCEGIAVSSRILASGQQQNLAIFVPGDIVNYEEFLLKQATSSVWALTPIQVINIPHASLSTAIEKFPGIAQGLSRDMAAGARIMQEWMVSMGRRPAYQRVAHFLCEVQVRFRAAGLGTEFECLFPLTQSELADTLGLSVVHINRVLQQLRREQLVHLAQSKLIIRDWRGLVQAGDFEPAYLGLSPRA